MSKSKAPADQFYYADFEADMRGHPLEIIGAWILTLGMTWRSDIRGVISKTKDQWARAWGVSEEKALKILTYLKNENIANVALGFSETNGKITVTSRRQVRDEKERASNRIRQKRHYQKTQKTVRTHANITPPSSSLHSSSLQNNALCNTSQADIRPYQRQQKLPQCQDCKKDSFGRIELNGKFMFLCMECLRKRHKGNAE